MERFYYFPYELIAMMVNSSALLKTGFANRFIKGGIAVSCLKAALCKSCPETSRESFKQQVGRLKHAGCPARLLIRSCEKIICWLKAGGKSLECTKKCKVLVTPYVHRMSRGLKSVAKKYGVDMVFFSTKQNERHLHHCSEKRCCHSNKCGVKHSFPVERVWCTICHYHAEVCI